MGLDTYVSFVYVGFYTKAVISRRDAVTTNRGRCEVVSVPHQGYLRFCGGVNGVLGSQW